MSQMKRAARWRERTPRTRAEWQEAADMAQFCLLLDAARQWGLVTGGPVINADRCGLIIDAAQGLGIRPAAAEKLCERYIWATLPEAG
jgi:hypothetical protein